MRLLVHVLLLAAVASTASAEKATGASVRAGQAGAAVSGRKHKDFLDVLVSLSRKLGSENQRDATSHGITSEMKDVFREHPTSMVFVRSGTQLSMDVSEQLCGGHDNEDASDAVRHFVLACYVGSKAGRVAATKFLNANEMKYLEPCDPAEMDGPTCWHESSLMDIYNNELGLNCGDEIKTRFPNRDGYAHGPARERIVALAREALETGRFAVRDVSDVAVGCTRSQFYPNELFKAVPPDPASYKTFAASIAAKR